MQRFIFALLLALLVSGCGTTPMTTETTREVVLQYLGGDVGTAGPFLQGGAKKELDGLSADDRRKAEGLIDQGAAVFLVYASGSAAQGANTGTRIVLVKGDKIVGDFQGAPKPANTTP